jgi:hypothetical protein
MLNCYKRSCLVRVKNVAISNLLSFQRKRIVFTISIGEAFPNFPLHRPKLSFIRGHKTKPSTSEHTRPGPFVNFMPKMVASILCVACSCA